MKKKVAIFIPAHNESRVIAQTLRSACAVVPPDDVYVVDDGSSDTTAQIAASIIPHVLSLMPNVGKAQATNQALKYFNILDNYEYLLPMDADTVLSPDFLNNTLPTLETDQSKSICCVVGKVVGRSNNWVTTFRLWEYEVAQTIHKAAQSVENAVIVCPGCATLYRTSVFARLPVPTGTLTEDMDFTFQIHRQKLGQIVYNPRAVVVTQDPNSLRDFLRQIDRWYTGFWQCVIKNNIPWGGQPLDLEVALLATEGIFNGLLVIALAFFMPYVLRYKPVLLLGPLLFDLVFFLLPTMLLTAKRHGSWKIFLYLPLFYLTRVLSCLVFLKSFIKVLLSADLKMGWNKAARYNIS